MNSLTSDPIQKNDAGEFKGVFPLPDSVSVYLVSLSVNDSLLAMVEIKDCVPLAKPEQNEKKEIKSSNKGLGAVDTHVFVTLSLMEH